GYEILMILDGELLLYNEGDAQKLTKGDLVLLDEFEFHRANLITREVYDRVVINVRKEKVQSLSSPKTDLLTCFKMRPDSKLNILHLDEDELLHFVTGAQRLEAALQDRRFGAEILADASLTEILVQINRIMKKGKPWEREQMMPEVVAKAFNYIEAHIADDLSMAVLQSELQYNGTYISRCFKQTLGMPIQKYIIAKRISVAQKLLREGETPYNVCFLAGFSNYSNFSRTFHQHIGKSPRAYRDEVLGKK
ncbi:MAG: AraC family transcriptional regulator, partial [Lachnospiraceae bacterium]|nr:AraC family transcriptional regulator [Lachnospiraceae bacterium]